jgi:hypothetical protein
MFARPRSTKRPDQDDGQKPVGQARPTEERFLLRVDGQTKRSFSSTATAGAAVKKAYPVVMVTVVDTEDGTVEVIEALPLPSYMAYGLTSKKVALSHAPLSHCHLDPREGRRCDW